MTLPDGGHPDDARRRRGGIHDPSSGRAGEGRRPEALADLMQRFLPRLRRWASGRLPGPIRDMADTSDLVQDVLLQSFQED